MNNYFTRYIICLIRYWEKRKRNNDAARRSRENKRRLDLDIRGRVVYLEENIASLRKELLVIKTKFKLPLDQTFTRWVI